tara:strand:- start:146 stop:658 length:513 start_codon:yes stop_codon:yes gene_type:complete
MIFKKNFTKFFIITVSTILLVSCANMKAVLDEKMSSSDKKEITVEQKLQVSIPIPENSKYLVDRTVIFGEGAKFSGILYLQHDETADDIIAFYRKNMIADGWSEIGIVRSKFILVNYEKENRFATIKVIRTLFEKSDSEITIGPKSSTQLEKSLDGNSGSSIGEEPFIVE